MFKFQWHTLHKYYCNFISNTLEFSRPQFRFNTKREKEKRKKYGYIPQFIYFNNHRYFVFTTKERGE